MEEVLEEIVSVSQQQNKMVAEVTHDKNHVHDEDDMAHIEYKGKVYSKKPIIMGTIMETVAMNAALKSTNPAQLHNVFTEFEGFLYPDEQFSVLHVETPEQTRSKLPASFLDDTLYTVALRKKDNNFAYVTLGFTPDEEFGTKDLELPNKISFTVGKGDVISFSIGTNSPCDYNAPGFVLASRSGIIVDNIRNPAYPELAALEHPDLFPVYRTHHAEFSHLFRGISIEDYICMDLSVKQEGKQDRPGVYTSVTAYHPLGDVLFVSSSCIQTLPKIIALKKALADK